MDTNVVLKDVIQAPTWYSLSLPIVFLKLNLSFDSFFQKLYKGKISGTVSVVGQPASRRVIVIERRFLKICALTNSDPKTGAYKFENLDPSLDYLVVCDDHTQTYNAAVADWVKPEVSA